MRITFDPAKREKTWRQRGLDFADAAVVFSGATLEVQDTRQDYGETRIIWFACRPDGGGGIHTAWRGSPCF